MLPRPSAVSTAMPMRAELHLILWVTAVASLSAVIFRGSFEAPQISLPVSGSVAEVSVLASTTSGQTVGDIASSFPRSLPDLDEDARPLFDVGELPQVLEVGAHNVPESGPPLLKGIISGADGLRAVFVLDATTTEYRVAGPGESIGEFRIKDVTADRVLAVSAGGDDVTFNLRGAGEHP